MHFFACASACNVKIRLLVVIMYLVQMLQRQDDFADVNSHFVLGEVLALVQMGEQLAAANVI